MPTRRAALPQEPFAFVARGKGLLGRPLVVPIVFMCNMRFGDYLQTDQSTYNKAAVAGDTVKRAFKMTKGGKKTSKHTGDYMKVSVEDMRPIYRRARDETLMRPAMRVHLTARGALDSRSGAPRPTRDWHLWPVASLAPGDGSDRYAAGSAVGASATQRGRAFSWPGAASRPRSMTLSAKQP